MKKLIALLMVLAMTLSFAACGDGGKSGGKKGDDAPQISGEIYDAGNVSALVPDGWMALPVDDFMSDDPTAANPDQFDIVKDGQDATSLWYNPYVHIVVFEPGVMVKPSPDYYNEAEMLDPITTGDLTWNVMSAQDLMGGPLLVLWTANAEGYEFQINVYKETDTGTIELTDADFLAILASVTNK